MTLPIASDHAGFALKEFLKKNVAEIQWDDLGPNSDARVDYPDYAEKVAKVVASGQSPKGILICGSGVGMAISANKFRGIRAVCAESSYLAALSRQHNDSNVLCIGSRITAPEYAIAILKAWLETKFEGGRHLDRLKKIAKLEK